MANKRAKVTDFPFKGRGTKSLRSKPTTAPKRNSNLRAADAHASSVRAAANRNKKAAPRLNGGGTLHDYGNSHPVKHMENHVQQESGSMPNGESKGQASKMAAFRARSDMK